LSALTTASLVKMNLASNSGAIQTPWLAIQLAILGLVHVHLRL
jgi:hypothetical protein